MSLTLELASRGRTCRTVVAILFRWSGPSARMAPDTDKEEDRMENQRDLHALPARRSIRTSSSPVRAFAEVVNQNTVFNGRSSAHGQRGQGK